MAAHFDPADNMNYNDRKIDMLYLWRLCMRRPQLRLEIASLVETDQAARNYLINFETSCVSREQ